MTLSLVQFELAVRRKWKILKKSVFLMTNDLKKELRVPLVPYRHNKKSIIKDIYYYFYRKYYRFIKKTPPLVRSERKFDLPDSEEPF